MTRNEVLREARIYPHLARQAGLLVLSAGTAMLRPMSPDEARTIAAQAADGPVPEADLRCMLRLAKHVADLPPDDALACLSDMRCM